MTFQPLFFFRLTGSHNIITSANNRENFSFFFILGGYKLWKRLSFFVAIPAVGVCMLNTYLEHQKEHADGHHRPPFVAYDYLRVRNKRFPWGEGNKSLFHVSSLIFHDPVKIQYTQHSIFLIPEPTRQSITWWLWRRALNN